MSEAKKAAGGKAAELVRSGMTVGLGTGSTAEEFIKALAGRAQKNGLRVTCVATSKASEELGRKLGLKVVGLDAIEKIDLAADGADLVDSRLRLIKGGGGAHAREKVVDYAAKKFVVMADESKLCRQLHGRIPLEVLPFAAPFVERQLFREYGVKCTRRPKPSDNGNVLMDALFGAIRSPERLEAELNQVPGVVENGLFTKNVSSVIIGLEGGKTRQLLK